MKLVNFNEFLNESDYGMGPKDSSKSLWWLGQKANQYDYTKGQQDSVNQAMDYMWAGGEKLGYKRGYEEGEVDAIARGRRTARHAIIITLGLGAIATMLTKLISSARKRYKMDIILKNETDPAKRERLELAMSALSQKEFNLKYKIKKIQQKQQNKIAKIKDSGEQATPKQLAELAKQKGKLEALTIQYKQLTSEITGKEDLRNVGRQF